MKGALLDRIKYIERGVTRGAEARIPFDHVPSRKEVSHITYKLARFVLRSTAEPQKVNNLSDHFGIKYFIQNNSHSNYRICAGLDALYIQEELLCKHRKTLQEYVRLTEGGICTKLYISIKNILKDILKL
jgi:hypothetical protein